LLRSWFRWAQYRDNHGGIQGKNKEKIFQKFILKPGGGRLKKLLLNHGTRNGKRTQGAYPPGAEMTILGSHYHYHKPGSLIPEDRPTEGFLSNLCLLREDYENSDL
jgi:hypothetical protein